MKIIFEYRQVVAAATKAAAHYSEAWEASKQKTIAAYMSQKTRDFPCFWRCYYPTAEQAWKMATENGIYEMSNWKRCDFRSHQRKCEQIARKAAEASASTDGNVILESNEIWLLEGHF